MKKRNDEQKTLLSPLEQVAAARIASTPRSLRTVERRALLRELKDSGLMDIRRALETVALHVGVSRAAV